MTLNSPNSESEKSEVVKPKIDQDSISKFIKENLQLVILIVVVILAGIGGFSIYRYTESKNRQMTAKNLYDFKVNTWGIFQKGQLTDEQLKNSFDNLIKVSKDHVQLLPIVMEMADYLIEKEGKEGIAGDLVHTAYEVMPKSSVAHYYLSNYEAAFLEDQGKIDEAISLLESTLSTPHKYLEAKVYFDLGRLYSNKGDKEKAKINFQYVVENFFQNSLAKMAKIYLQRL